jgi:hypothetical protein
MLKSKRRYAWLMAIACACSSSCSKEAAHDSDDAGVAIEQRELALTTEGDPIASVGHGAILDAQGRNLDPDRTFILNTQRLYLERLQREASRETSAQLEKKRARLKEVVQDEILLNSAVITWLLNQGKPGDGAFIAAKSAALRDHYLRKYAKGSAAKLRYGLSDKVRDLLDREGAMPQALTKVGGREYIEECRNAGVPIPPDWGTAGWGSGTNLPMKFIVTGMEAEVFTFESAAPRGVCMALPRFAAGSKTISLLGVICLGTDTSKACFWDASNVPWSGVTPLTSLRGGTDLVGGDVCSDCHAGENPFVVHPGSPLDLGNVQRPNAWYDPLVDGSWPQNPGPTNLLDAITIVPPAEGSCLNCHQYGTAGRFPEASNQLPGWCTSVFRNAVGQGPQGNAVKTMPLGGGGADFSKHINAIFQACDDPPVVGTDVPAGDIKEDPKYLSPPIVIEPLYGCATKVVVRGALLHAKLHVEVDGANVNSVEVLHPNQQVVDVPALVAGQIVTARQEYGGVVSDPSAGAKVRDHKIDFPAGLPAPTIDPSLIYECGNVIAVRHLPGANVTVFTNGIDPRTYGTGGGWTNLAPAGAPFKYKDEFTAQYEICGDPSPISNPAEKAINAPATVPAPKFDPPLTYNGQELVTMDTLLNGALTYASVVGFGDVAKFSTAVSWMPDINVAVKLGRPLQNGDVLEGMQVLCDKGPPGRSEPTTDCQALPPPRIRHPHVGDTVVVVTSAVPGARIRVTTALNEELGDGSGSVIALSRAITSTDVLLVVQQIGECTSSLAYRVSVRNGK